jgi:2'-5' RNA ligase
MRVFVGIELPEPMRAAAAGASARLRALLSRHAPGLQLRWVEPANLHLTLWFIGEVTDERRHEISKSLERPWSTPSFRIEIGGAGLFPVTGPPRVVWLGVRRGEEALRTLHAEVEERLVNIGFEAERRTYSAHLTVARVKVAGRVDAAAARKCLADVATVVESGTVGRLTLFCSRLSPHGSRYDALLHVPLN